MCFSRTLCFATLRHALSRRLVGLTNACRHRFPSLLCWLVVRVVSLCLCWSEFVSSWVFSRLSGCTPSDPSQFARHCRIHDHFQLLLSFSLSGFFNFHVLQLNMTSSSSAYEHCRASACQYPTAVSPFAKNSSTWSTHTSGHKRWGLDVA